MGNGQISWIGADGLALFPGAVYSRHGDPRIKVLIEKTCGGSVRLTNCAFWGPARQCVVLHSSSFILLSDYYLSGSGQEKNPGVPLALVDGGKLRMRWCGFGTDETGIALRPGLKHAIVIENDGVRGVGIRNETGDQTVMAIRSREIEGRSLED